MKVEHKIFQIYRGLFADKPTEASLGELLYITDKEHLYIGNGTGQALTKVGDASINDSATSSNTETYSINKINEKINSAKECVNFTITHQYTGQNKPLKDIYTGDINKTIDYVYYDSGVDIGKTQKLITTEGNRVVTKEFTYVSGTDYINTEIITITYI